MKQLLISTTSILVAIRVIIVAYIAPLLYSSIAHYIAL
jgi:hypothetical protein